MATIKLIDPKDEMLPAIAEALDPYNTGDPLARIVKHFNDQLTMVIAKIVVDTDPEIQVKETELKLLKKQKIDEVKPTEAAFAAEAKL